MRRKQSASALLTLKDIQRSKVNTYDINLGPEFLSHPTHPPTHLVSGMALEVVCFPKDHNREIFKEIFPGLCHCLVAKAAIYFQGRIVRA